MGCFVAPVTEAIVVTAAALIVKIIPENYRVKIAENLIRDEYNTSDEYLDGDDKDV